MDKFWCPICLATKNSLGSDFYSFNSVVLHVAGKALHSNPFEPHRRWVRSEYPQLDLREATINQVKDQIYYGVESELLKQQPPVDEALPSEDANRRLSEHEDLRFDDIVTINPPKEHELNQYMHGYQLVWYTERQLITFLAGETKKSEAELSLGLLDLLPHERQLEIMSTRNSDKKKLPPHTYLNLLDLAEIIGRNQEYFAEALERLQTTYKQPWSSLNGLLRHANMVRNKIMHPLKGIAPSEKDLAQLQELKDSVSSFIASPQE